MSCVVHTLNDTSKVKLWSKEIFSGHFYFLKNFSKDLIMKWYAQLIVNTFLSITHNKWEEDGNWVSTTWNLNKRDKNQYFSILLLLHVVMWFYCTIIICSVFYTDWKFGFKTWRITSDQVRTIQNMLNRVMSFYFRNRFDVLSCYAKVPSGW